MTTGLPRFIRHLDKFLWAECRETEKSNEKQNRNKEITVYSCNQKDWNSKYTQQLLLNICKSFYQQWMLWKSASQRLNFISLGDTCPVCGRNTDTLILCITSDIQNFFFSLAEKNKNFSRADSGQQIRSVHRSPGGFCMTSVTKKVCKVLFFTYQ